MIQVVTYATHSQGMFDELLNNSFGIDVKVLGWGEKWNGFNDKFIGVYNYIKNLSDEDIIIFVDGFDSKIIKPLNEAKQRFLEMDCKILFSLDPDLYGKNTSKMVFGTCKNDITLNTGLYMGYVKYIKQILKDAVQMKCKDDQKNINSLCKKYTFIEIDVEEKIFSNKNNRNSCFIQIPGERSFDRIVKRGLKEYTQFYIYHYIIGIFILLSLYPTKYTFLLVFIFLFLFFSAADKSCI